MLPVLAIDNIDVVAGNPEWELQLFGLYNDCLSRGTRLAVAAPMAAGHLGVTLPDLRSRLAAMPQYALRPLNETQQREALALRAAMRGMELPDETLLYLQRHFARDMGRLHELLDRLDQASLQEQRRLTVPFIREVLGGST
jgi:DnaA family protein